MATDPTPTNEQVNQADNAAATVWMIARNAMLRYAPGWIIKIAAFATIVGAILYTGGKAPDQTPPQQPPAPVINVHVPPMMGQQQPAIALPPINDLPALKAMFHRGYVPLTAEKRTAYYQLSHARHAGRLAMLAQNQDLPPAFDCRDKGWVLPVGDQAQCGSCYLYSTVYGTASQAFVKAGYGKPDGSFVMSVQFGMDCHDFGGCNGGNGTEVIDWMCNHGWPAEKWIDTDGKAHNDYPAYEARSRSCRTPAGAKLWKPASWGFVSASQNRPATVLEIKTAMFNYGALNLSLDAGGQFGNGTGTITRLGSNVDHEIEGVAFDDNHDNGDGTKGAILLKNQWTKDWGVQGYRWLAYHQVPQLVDVFFVTATPLPPPPQPTPPNPPTPPVPPVPPGPTPPPPLNGPSITYQGFGPSIDGTFAKMLPNSITFDKDRLNKDLLKPLADFLNAINPPKKTGCDCGCANGKPCTCEKCPAGGPPPIVPPPSQDGRIDQLQKDFKRVLDLLEKQSSNAAPIETATLIVTVPPNAKVWVNGEATNSTGETRKFITPAFSGKGHYTLTVIDNGQRWTRGVILQAGKITRVTIGSDEWTMTAR